MKYHVRQACLLDFLRIIPNLREFDIRSIRNMADSEPGDAWAASSYLGSSARYALVREDGRIISICGVMSVRTGVTHVWAVCDREANSRAAYHYFHFLKQLFEAIEATTNHRIECFCLAEFEDAHRTIKRLGFTEEGVQRAAGSFKEDVVIYSRRKSC